MNHEKMDWLSKETGIGLLLAGTNALIFGWIETPFGHILKEFGLGRMTGLLMSTFWIAAILVGFSISNLLLERSLKTTYLIAFGLTSLACLGYSLSHDPVIIALSRFMHGAAYGLCYPAFSVIIRRSVQPLEAQKQPISWEGSVTAISLGLGGVLASLLISHHGHQFLWGAVAVMMSLCCIVSLIWLPKYSVRVHHERKGWSGWIHQNFDLPSLKLTFWGMGTSLSNRVYLTFLPLALGNLALASKILLMTTVMNALIGPPVSKLMKWLEDEKQVSNELIVVVSRLLMVGGLTILAFSQTLAALLVVATLMPIAVKGHNFGTDQAAKKIGKKVTPASTAFKNSMNVAFLLGTLYGGSIGGEYGFKHIWLATIPWALISTVAAVIYLRRSNYYVP
ncbi:Predicted arabinose efflux permease, MFS family [Seinonella peptonophila]|uniref:Predicted arabinose efflux permease, MFS family n=1 Tax=Seinonella peptonophila TaxID=112248 RepID=A0A1M4Y5Q9_9BACL|nr:MFS transporter [Seinonella peptonophila]SHF00956.1 Predicted arabinose efflux permease, MFS family [Seinonella peptonophila]